MLFWAATSLVLIAALVLAVPGPGALDDPDQADQRPGFLLDPGEARVVEDLELPGDPLGRRPVLAIFDRRAPTAAALERFVDEAPERSAVFLVLPARSIPTRRVDGARIVADAAGAVARAVGLPQPNGGGAPVGYALVDSKARVRYATLDPTYLEHAFELEAVGGSIR